MNIEQKIASYIRTIDKLNEPIVTQRNVTLFQKLEPHLLPELCKIVLEFAAHERYIETDQPIDAYGLFLFGIPDGRYVSWRDNGELKSMGIFNMGVEEGRWKKSDGRYYSWKQRNYPNDRKYRYHARISHQENPAEVIEKHFTP